MSNQEKKNKKNWIDICAEESITCNKPMLVYSRVVGYIRPVENWNDAKREEFTERKTYRAYYGDYQRN